MFKQWGLWLIKAQGNFIVVNFTYLKSNDKTLFLREQNIIQTNSKGTHRITFQRSRGGGLQVQTRLRVNILAREKHLISSPLVILWGPIKYPYRGIIVSLENKPGQPHTQYNLSRLEFSSQKSLLRLEKVIISILIDTIF